MHATPAGPTENVPQKTPILLLYHILARPKKSALPGLKIFNPFKQLT
jgi:hypothetical protein